jgi:hypothetical protein
MPSDCYIGNSTYLHATHANQLFSQASLLLNTAVRARE